MYKNRLTCLVDVVVFMLVDVSSHMASGPLDVSTGLLVLVQSSLLVQLLLVLGKHVFLVFADYARGDRVNMLGLEGLLMSDGLDAVLRLSMMKTRPGSPGDGAHVALGQRPRQSRYARGVECAPG